MEIVGLIDGEHILVVIGKHIVGLIVGEHIVSDIVVYNGKL